MVTTVNLAVGAGVCAVLVLLVILIIRLNSHPAPPDGCTVVYLTAATVGDASHLEQTLNCLEALRRSSGVAMELVIADMGLDGEGRRIAEIEARRRGLILVKLGDNGELTAYE